MSTHNIRFNGELTKIILQLTPNTLLICSSGPTLFAYTCLSKYFQCWLWKDRDYLCHRLLLGYAKDGGK